MDLVEAELQDSGIEGGRHGASFLAVHSTEISPGATGLQHKGDREPTGQISRSCRTPFAFIHMYKPVPDDKPYRSFETMTDYRNRCNKHLPMWLRYRSD